MDDPGFENQALDDQALDDRVYDDEADATDELVAVVGMAGRFPEAPDLDAFWHNLRTGRDCLHTFSDAELDALGIPARFYQRDNFIRRGTILPDRDGFDARFFGYTPNQAAIMDPQARIFLETCYEALESAGYNPYDTGNTVGVFAGSNPNDYALLLGVADPTDSLSAFDQLIGVDRDFVATRVSHSLNLTGPAMTIQTACSTSLVTIHAAVQSLLAYESSMALAGGVSVNLRQGVGYFYQQGMILSPAGECRAFDARAEGTTLGQGCGVVALRRLADALDDGDQILAVVRATAINNDGSAKISYTAPSEDGQTAVIAAAHALAGVESDSIDYVETHGTGTLLGDPIEVAALTRAFRPGTTRTQYCAIGSAKTAVGHTDAAAGVTGFIKTVLALHHREIPPSLHFDEPNPAIDFVNSPFFVNAELRPWPGTDTPRRAGVSAFGIGGTNAHAVLEEAPPAQPSTGTTRPQVLVVSAKTSAAADQRLADLATVEVVGAPTGAAGPIVDGNRAPDAEPPSLRDVAFTLVRGRPAFDHRRAVVVEPGQSIAAAVAGDTGARVVRGNVAAGSEGRAPGVVWLFAGQGAQYPSMGRDLYRTEPVFAAAVDRVAEVADGLLGLDLRRLVFADPGDEAAEALRQTSVTQPALFAVEHAMACLLRSWGLTPDAVIGHSIGEYAAAVEAGVMSWEDAIRLVVERGRLMQSMAPGSMLAVPLPAAEVTDRLPDGVELAAENSSQLSVVSGPTAAVEAFAAQLEEAGTRAQLLHTSHGFHSAMMTEAADAFAPTVATATLQPPRIPLVANVTGRPLTDDEATDPSFWARQIRRPVRFSSCLATVIDAEHGPLAGPMAGPMAFIELGPGRALSTFVNAHDQVEAAAVTPTMRHPREDRPDRLVALEAMARLWAGGVELDWDAVNGTTGGRRVALPTYPFERQRAWLPPYEHVLALPHFGPPSASAAGPTAREPIDRWLYTPSWRREPAPDRAADGSGTTLGDGEGPAATVILAPEGPGGDAFMEALAASPGRERLVEVRPGDALRRDGDRFVVDPSTDDDLAAVLTTLGEEGVIIDSFIHAWLAQPVGGARGIDHLDQLERALDVGVHTLMASARALSGLGQPQPVRLDVVTAGAFSVLGNETIRPEATALRGPVKAVPREYPGLSTRLIDVPVGLGDADDLRSAVEALEAVAGPSADPEVVALRLGQRWAPTVAVRPTSEPSVPTGDEGAGGGGASLLRPGGRYLIVGGLGEVGLSIAHHLAQIYRASLVLTSRRGRPTADVDADADARRRVEVLDEIGSLAGELDVVAVDAGNESAMTALIETVEAGGRRLDGVIVADGALAPDQMGAIHYRSRADMTASVASGIRGSLVLERALGDRELDFVLLSSSLASVLCHHPSTQVGSVTASSFVEAFAHRACQRGRRTVTVAWDSWLHAGTSISTAHGLTGELGTADDLVGELHSLSPADGVRLFERALTTEEPVLLVSTTDLERRVAADVEAISTLGEHGSDGGDGPEPSAGSEGGIEGLVRAAWSALLGFETFDANDDFFELGGDSLLAARMADRLTRALGLDVAVEVIFDAPALGALVGALEELAATGPTAHSAEGVGFERVDPVVLSPGQRRFLDRGSEHPDHWNTSVLLTSNQPVAEDRLRAAVDELLERHQALRLRLVPPTHGEPRRQQALPRVHEALRQPHPLTVVDLSGIPRDDALAAMTASATETQQGMELEHGPIFRVVLYELPGGEQRILVVVHHLMADRVSFLLMIDGLEASLGGPARSTGGGAAANAASSIAPVTSVLDWIEALVRAGTSPEGEAYATEVLGRPWDRVRPLPVDRPADPAANRNETVGVVVEPVPAAAVTGAGSDARPDELFLLALAQALAQWSETDAALVEVLGHGRRLPLDVDVSRSVGMFLTYSPVVLDLADPGGLEALIGQVRHELAGSWRFDPVRCYATTEIGTELDRLPRAQVLYNYLGRAIATDDTALLSSATEDRGPESDPGGQRDHPLAVRAELVDDETFELSFVYSTAFHDAATIELLAKATREALLELTAAH
jgi:acyl transferase domain-containing protein